MTNTGVHGLAAEFAAVGALARQLRTTKSRIVRAAIVLAGESGEQELRAAISRLEPLCGEGLQSGIFLSVAELAVLDGLAAAACVSRSRLVRAAVGLLLDEDDMDCRRLVGCLPMDGRLKAQSPRLTASPSTYVPS